MLVLSITANACVAEDMKSDLIFEDDFSHGLESWVVEQQPGGSVQVVDGKLDIRDKKGCTVWLDKKLSSPVRISYTVTILSDERVSDMNCFWLASDPDHPGDIFAEGHGREGIFAHYDALQLYYVGYGGNHNSTTRFRRYLGTGERPLLEGYDLKEEVYLLEGDKPYQITLEADGSSARYFRDGELVFEYKDPNPLKEGWFGFRTVWSHMQVDDFKVERLEEDEA